MVFFFFERYYEFYNILLRVFPGGRVDIDESIEETVLREIKEEIGIAIEKNLDEMMNNENEENIKKNIIKSSHVRPFFIWESVYPTNLKYGLPQLKIIFFYYISLDFFNELEISSL